MPGTRAPEPAFRPVSRISRDFIFIAAIQSGWGSRQIKECSESHKPNDYQCDLAMTEISRGLRHKITGREHLPQNPRLARRSLSNEETCKPRMRRSLRSQAPGESGLLSKGPGAGKSASVLSAGDSPKPGLVRCRDRMRERQGGEAGPGHPKPWGARP